MIRKIAAIVVIYVVVSVAWVALGGSIAVRTESVEGSLRRDVSALWGASQTQVSPEVSFTWPTTERETEQVEDSASGEKKLVKREKEVWRTKALLIDRSKVDVDLHMDYRKKGLLWYSTYAVDFRGGYSYTHGEEHDGWRSGA